MARRRVKQIISNTVSIITPPPYSMGQPIKIGVRRGVLYPTAMTAVVTYLDKASISFTFGGGKEESLQLRADGTAIESELSKPEKKKA